MISSILLLVPLFLFYILNSSSMLAYDCGHERINLTAISLLSVGACMREKQPIMHQEEEIQLLQMSEVASLHIFQCKINVIQSVFRCDMFSHQSLVSGGLTTFLMEINKEECMTIHHHQTFRLQNGRVIANIKRNASTFHTETIAGFISDDGKCNGAAYTSGIHSWDSVIVTHAMEFTIMDYQGSVRLEDNMVILRNNILCPYLSGVCTDPEYGMSFWDLLSDNSCETTNYDVLWQGKATKISKVNNNGDADKNAIVYTVTSDDIIFALEIKKAISVCRFIGYQTEHPRLVIFPKLTQEYWFIKRTTDVKNLDLFTYMNSKFVYTERHIKTQIEKLYDNLLMKKCELERTTLQTQLFLASHHPAEFALMQTKIPGYIAVPRGEIIYLVKCQPVEVKIRKVEQCFMELPVSYGEQEYFMTPITRLLIQHGTEIPCSEFLSPAYYINGEWYGFNPILHRIKTPAELQPHVKADWEYEDPGKLIQAGLYSSSSLENLRHQIMYPSERQAIAHIIAQNIIGHDVDQQNLDTGNILTKKTLETIHEGVRAKMWGIFDGIRDFCITIIIFYSVVKLIKFLCDIVVNVNTLKILYGWSWKLIAALWNSTTNHILHKHHRQQRENVILQEVITSTQTDEARAEKYSDDQTKPTESTGTADLYTKIASLYSSLPK